MQLQHFSVNNSAIKVYLRDEADQSVAAEIFTLHEYRIAEPVIAAATNTIVDVGAHSGMFTIYARQLNRTVPIIAIEPEKNNVALLTRHLEENNVENVTIIAGAMAFENGHKKLLITEDSHNHRLANAFESGKTETVQTYTLANIIKKCSGGTIGLLKMDIEGGEYEVFDGTTPNDLSHIKALIMEYHAGDGRTYKDIELKLRENGFGVQIFPSKFDKTMGFLWAVNKRT